MNNVLLGEHIKLTVLARQDAHVIATWQEEHGFLRNLDALPAAPKSIEQIEEWLDGARKSANSYLFGIRLKETDELIGYVEIDGILWNHRVAGIAIAIGTQTQRGRGYGREALERLLAFAFMELNLHRVQLTVFAYNQPAITLYEKMGFKQEGVYREFLCRDGQRHDMLLYGMLEREWRERMP
ncbi:MAG: GNAT family N-acetyltransferase [Clostridia bacterium]